MNALLAWRFLEQGILENGVAALLIVVDSKGSSPGRVGFKMVVKQDGTMIGSIGGGIMEHKLVEFVRDRLRIGEHFWEIRRQIHSKDAPTDQSGMICSGEQSIALLRIDSPKLPDIQAIIKSLENGEKVQLSLDQNRMAVFQNSPAFAVNRLELGLNDEWKYQETIGIQDIAHVVGAGHVGLEMCKILYGLDFHVINYDDRPNLNTMEANHFAHEKVVIPYDQIGANIVAGSNVYVIVMTFGYRGDDVAIRALIGHKFKYFGMMGSEAKVAKLLSDLKVDGFLDADIAAIRTPAGLIPHCKTASEIALSVAAEILMVRNSIL